MVTLKVEKHSGRGLYASGLILRGTIVMECEILVLSSQDTVTVNQTDLKHYTFKFNETQDCLVLGLGEIFNHDDKANVDFELVERDGRKLMQFRANNYVVQGQQLFINYNADVQVDVSRYVEAAPLIA